MAEHFECPSLATGEAFSAIYNAILDPGHYTEQLRSFPPPLRQMEPVARWQTRAVMAALGRLQPGLRITHGRHCVCSACEQEDWTNPDLAPCGMHGSDCPARYQPLGAPGDLVPR